jgi:hypothetical protein
MNQKNISQKRNTPANNVIPYIKKQMSPAKIAGLVFIVLLLIVCLINIYKSNMAYTGYEILASVTRDDGSDASYMKYGEGYIRYSNDGIAYYKNNGNVVWNHAYEISNVQVKTCEDYIVVGDITGRTLYVYNKSGLKANIDAAMTITQVDVAKQGVTAVSLEDGDTNYINMYDANGTKISYIITSLTGDGYPIDMALSDDGTKLAVVFISVNGEELQTNLAFYNFSDVGQNSVDRLVGGFNHYGSSIIGRVEFVDNETVIAVAQDRVSFYNISQYPELKEEYEFTEELQKITYNEDYVGLIYNNADSVDKYKMLVFNMKGQNVSTIYFNEDYRNFEFYEDSILLYNEKTFTLMTIKGKIKYQDSFDMTIEKIIPLDKNQRFLVFNSKYVQQIKLN